MITSMFFYILAAILILSCIGVITAKNPVHAVLLLVLAFVTSSCLWIMLNVEFLALALILVYVGAVMVLFLFIVMMLDIDLETMRKGFWHNLPLALLLGLVVLVEMVAVLITKPMVIAATKDTANTYQLFWVLYTQYSLPVELASLILLLGLVVAVALTLRKTYKNGKYQDINKQIAINAKDRIEMINMQAEVEIENGTSSLESSKENL